MEDKGKNWRAEVGENLSRLQSLLFGAESAAQRGDHATAQVLGLRLLGFLDSRTVSPLDAAYITPIRTEVQSRVAAASRALAPDSDQQAYEQARRDVGHIFVKSGAMDIQNITISKHFQDFLRIPRGNIEDQMVSSTSSDANLFSTEGCDTQKQQKQLEIQFNRQHEKLSIRASKLMTQMKITSIYGSNSMKLNQTDNKKQQNSEGFISMGCIDVESEHSESCSFVRNADDTALQTEEEEKSHAITLKPKRKHSEFTSPICANVKSPPVCEEANVDTPGNVFVTARAKLEMDARRKHSGRGSLNPAISAHVENNPAGTARNYGMRSGFPRRGFRGNFVPPIKSNGGNAGNTISSRISEKNDDLLDDSTRTCLEILCGPDGELPEKLRNIEPRLIEHVSNEIMDKDPNVRWNDIAGLEHAKKCVTEMVIWPLLRPDIFRGCRSPGRGLLLFGPPGTGKTMIGKAIAGEAKATFFYISASSLTSKWIGEGEKLVRALFGVASCRQPAVIFVDEIDSLLSQRKSDGEHESSRRLKTQFLIEMEGFDSGNEQILLVGATNRPQELDEAARRRLTKRLYIPLPSSEARACIVRNLLDKDGLFQLSDEDNATICKLTEGYSGSDMKNLVKDASMGPLREALRLGIELTKLKKEDMRPVTLQDFKNALQEVRPSVSFNELGTYEEWNRQFGSLSM
ncbi:ATPase family AAA domain-containing protein FIGL1 isoform X2 [Dendrobium catenatum]|uniref:Katanin p60 ATPase-containing subunit A1 n=1 Tax=Dendrobium catenatum TaxID=906689 RepID=A0A2I0WAY0_9ASPA|nr:ATPase family AAA domain-containing protein FIGL1 isoform X2 [Dendrobium catenatum]PKU72817.1 Katanin p60 ATPase-containing subunit A1 [Dendrobium catenatum]